MIICLNKEKIFYAGYFVLFFVFRDKGCGREKAAEGNKTDIKQRGLCYPVFLPGRQDGKWSCRYKHCLFLVRRAGEAEVVMKYAQKEEYRLICNQCAFMEEESGEKEKMD